MIVIVLVVVILHTSKFKTEMRILLEFTRMSNKIRARILFDCSFCLSCSRRKISFFIHLNIHTYNQSHTHTSTHTISSPPHLGSRQSSVYFWGERSAHCPRGPVGELGRLHCQMVSALAHLALRSLTLARSTTVGSSSQHGQWKNVSFPATSGHVCLPQSRLLASHRDTCLGFRSRHCLPRPRSVILPPSLPRGVPPSLVALSSRSCPCGRLLAFFWPPPCNVPAVLGAVDSRLRMSPRDSVEKRVCLHQFFRDLDLPVARCLEVVAVGLPFFEVVATIKSFLPFFFLNQVIQMLLLFHCPAFACGFVFRKPSSESFQFLRFSLFSNFFLGATFIGVYKSLVDTKKPSLGHKNPPLDTRNFR